ncbi:hypothetical protein ACFL1U_02930 [Patescibacteria group bacterium]
MDLGTINPGRSGYGKIIIGFVVFSIILVVVVAYFSFAHATITITPVVEDISVDFETHVDTSANFDPRNLDKIPGRLLQADLDAKVDVADVGAKEVPQRAHVTVTIYNKRGTAQPLLATTQLVNQSGIKFRTDARVVVPANGSIQVGATADIAGKVGNVGPSDWAIILLSPSMQKLVYAKSTAAATGGVKSVSFVSESDLNAAKQTAIDQSWDQGYAALTEQLEGSEQLADDSILAEVVSFESSAAEGSEVSSFNVTAKVGYRAVVFDESILLNLAVTKLKEQVPAEKDLGNFNTATFSYKVLKLDVNSGLVRISVHLEGQIIPKLGTDAFDKSNLFGLTKAEVEEFFASHEGVSSVKVSLRPPWVRSVPSIEDKVKLVIELPEAPKPEEEEEVVPEEETAPAEEVEAETEEAETTPPEATE